MLNILGALIALGILITVHEAGHAVAATIFGIEIEKFSIGFGPRLISFRRKKTEFRISLIPLGGYLKMKGENPGEEITDPKTSFKTKSWWQRALVAFAGPLANLLLALIVFIFSFLVGRYYEDSLPIIGKINTERVGEFHLKDRIISINGEEIHGWNQLIQNTREGGYNSFEIEREGKLLQISSDNITPATWVEDFLPYAPPIVGEVAPGLPAYNAGIMNDDRILEVNGVKVNDWYEMREIVLGTAGDQVVFLIERAGRQFEKAIPLEENIIDSNRIVGITQKLPVRIEEKFNALEAVEYGTLTTVSFVAVNYVLLFRLLSKPSSIKSNLGGPVMIFTMSQQTVKKGWDTILVFFAAISIILMVMNLLPVPVLDGGHIFFCLVEGIFQKPFSEKIQVALQNIGFIILLALMVFAFWNDFDRLFKRKISLQQQNQNSENLLTP
ncbi:MAG: RIP metalloprotease RseP [Candidatus Cloacimonetes bacterium]|nr:RIP metalloprotease RseP [Candidatus Cloacimonadota bacterium]